MEKIYNVKIFTTGYHFIKLFMFFMYNVAYVFYMLGYMGRNVNLVLLAIFIGLCMLEYCTKNGWILGKKSDNFLDEFKNAMMIVLFFLSISIVIQLSHGGIRGFLFNKILYNLIPPVLAFFWINSTYLYERYTYFVIFLFRNVLYFILANITNFSLSNIASISWNDSTSSVFETPYAHDFFFLEIIFFYFGKSKLGILCMILCMLNFKRVSFLMSLGVCVIYFVWGRRKNLINFFYEKGSVNKILQGIIFISLCIMPFLVKWAISDTGLEFFKDTFNIDLDLFTTGRVGVMRYTFDNIGYFNGYGSANNFLRNCPNETYRVLASMHCDILEVFMETTIIGLSVFLFAMLKIAKRNWLIFMMLMYIFMELVVSHFMDALSVWNLFFMFTAMVYAQKQEIYHKQVGGKK